ncbi:prepilin-type N-terminal cleavage/methylation domain-containing protein [Carboxydothermus islandicus]|uniref:Prepilin-type N-terminal cleavage/methylation domain-containing protein n=1 Tax=Carboxydothermus islandicus TaxID=661089 RepID=A0A1L8D439_9THEO|nr:prepilin-type N-terminal cleavage/methylation domain-containing protein [Carboxydothermus islandicus]GAV25938.1 prepilin-type N-terminal cleavage/methylation domain-containing protein [Carboxydothermus islandicus]
MKDKGFTLVELLVVLVIGSIILLVVFNLFVFTYNLWFKGQKAIDYQEQLRFAMDRMAREIRTATAVYNPYVNPPSPGTAYTQVYLINTVNNDTYRVYYYLNSLNKTLYRKVYYPNNNQTTDPLISDVNFAVYYLGYDAVTNKIYNLKLNLSLINKPSATLSTSVVTRLKR